ncbi:Non-ribosomal peptide synthase, involved in Hassallidin biosynthesis [Planktothrix serta PCC 8927]|uniref:Non-ribosomal peptide synthase, involved in Hassallidin biosynthesis n=1 Tax=Planktothrix serta PCC 8927 TaxID=671068 RepID=A0A1J1JNR9_9CYAN|nr:non-ribosomal peptide synthetase [Planktothrix serta]CZT62784.1 Non-ribosomal peptide synthase, involved in Hassallidin biosynthesis [Planktothrix serta PCC 8927]VXD10548.1 Non-ribosomal peptide synthase, involved in Hassallidin biosynthesis [Planktothrix serta PCC 8927]
MPLKAQIEDIFPLTPLQKGLLFHSLYEPESGIYFEQFHCRLEGDVSVSAVRQAWQTLVNRHPILRTAIITKGQTEPVQVVFRELVFNILEEDWRGLNNSAQATRFTEFLEADRRKGFILNRPPLMRVTLIRLAQDSWHLVWSHHHLILDGWSWPLLLREFLMLHKAKRENVEISLPNIRPYGDFLAWLKQKNPQDSEAFWHQYMDGFESATPLLMISKTKPEGAFLKGEIKQLLASEVTELLQKLAQNCRITLNTVIQGAWAILLNRYSRNQDLVYGITVAGRPPELPGVEGMIGPFINTLPLRVFISEKEPLDTWLQNLQTQVVLMRQFEHSSLSDIQGWSDVPRGQPLFESLLAFENFPVDTSLKAGDFGLNVPECSFFETTHYPLTLVVVPGNELSLKLSYNADRFDTVAMELLLKQFCDLLINMANNAQEPLQSLSLNAQLIPKLDREEETPKPILKSRVTLKEKFAKIVNQYPQRTALTFENQNLTYQEIDTQSNRIAHYLKRQGIGAEKRVVICLERSPELIIAMLAVVKAGGVYVPVDPAYPRERIEFTVSDCEAKLILTTTAIRSHLPESQIKICLDEEDAPFLTESTEPLSETLDPNSGAYIIYTSGSTGQPKGVLITQHNLIRLFQSTEHWFAFNEQDVWTFFHSFAFDFSVWEIWGALLYGGRIAIVPHCISRNPQSFLQLLQQEQVTVLNQTPSAFAQLLACRSLSDKLSKLRYIIFGGEALNLPSLRPWFEHFGENQTRLVNMYGITETTVHVTYRLITKQDIDNSSGSLIGQPIPDLDLYILDPYGNPLPPGVIGEIYIGGAGVASGYINRPELTAQRFVKDCFADLSVNSDSHLYRSGDLGRFLPNGDLEYLGRIDNQIKIRGFRIEIGEIEAAICQFSEVREALVLTNSDTETEEKYLIAYIVCYPEKQPSIETLRKYLQTKLPEFMIPAQFVYLEKFPLTHNGKVDRKALPKPETKRENLEVSFIPPATPIEEILADIWQQVLGVEQVSRFDNYFVLGGDSIRSIRVVSLAQSQGINLKLEQIFSYPVLSDLAARVTQSDVVENIDDTPFALISTADQEKLLDWADNAYPLAKLQTGMLFHSEYSEASTTYHDVFSFRIRIPFDIKNWEKAYTQIVARHRVLRTAFYLAEFSQPLQVVVKQVPAKVGFEDITHLSTTAQDTYIKSFIDQERKNRFDYKLAPLMRFHIHLLDKNVMQATLTLHHAIADGWSLANLLTELTSSYLHLTNKNVPPLPPAPQLEYSRFIALEQQALKDDKQREFWQQQIAGLPFTQLPRLHETNSSESKPKTGKIDIILPDSLSQRVKNLAHQLGVPLRTVLLALHLHILAVFSGEEEVVTGLVSNSRPTEIDSDRVLGLFLNTLPLRLKLPSGSWIDLIQKTWRAEQALMPNRHFPASELQRLNGNQPFYETSFNFVHFHVYEGLLKWREVELIQSESLDETNIPFAVSWSEEVATVSLALNITYNTGQFSDRQITTIAHHYQHSLEALTADPHAHRLIYENHEQLCADIPYSPPPSQWVHEKIAQQAAKTPDATAVIFEGDSWTYAQLNQKANQLARFLLSCGIGLDKAVGICLKPSLEMICALLAVLKVGGCYVPIDPQYPLARIQRMLQDAEISLLLSHSDLQIPDLAESGSQVLFLNHCTEEINQHPSEDLNLPIWGENLAYIIFTSGSTGHPKSIAISHQALACHINWFIDTFSVSPHDIIFQKTSLSFDASVDELWAPLMVGAKLLIGKQGAHQDPGYLVQKIKSEEVTLLVVVPSLLEVLLGEPEFAECSSLRLMFSGGEALKTRVWEQFYKLLGIPLVNIYGPAETTVESVYHTCRDREKTATIPIGQPVKNTRLYILNSHLQPVPIGTPGELFIAGYQLARGYWRAPRITAENFLPDPFTENAGCRMYRTGDRARYLPDGNIEFLGRADQQVKVRGFRIETGEIVAALEKQPWVTCAVVKAFSLPDEPSRLIAYLELKETPANWQKKLRLELAQNLPNYMIPSLFIKISNWLLLPNGKIDINSLPHPEAKDAAIREEYVAPQNEIESVLTNLWEQVLQVSSIGVSDNFFELGGDSIMGLQIIAKARDKGFYFSPQDLFKYPQVAALASQVKILNHRSIATLPKIEAGEVPLTPIQNWFFQQSLLVPGHWNQSILLNIKPEFESSQFHTALTQIAKTHPAFHLRFRHTETGWVQELAKDNHPLNFDIVDLTHIPEKELSEKLPPIATQFQSQLNLERGPLFRAVYFKTEENAPDKLLLIIHHLIVDGVSWRIILRDLAYCILHNPEEIAAKSVSFPQWSYYLQHQTQDYDWEQELNFWKTQSVDNPTLPIDFPKNILDNKESSIGQIECHFTKEETDTLLLKLPRTHKARIQEVLLTALLFAVTEWTGDREITIALESHGRETLTNQKTSSVVDISDTIGWFTSLFPCKLEKIDSDIFKNLAAIQKHLENLLNHSFSYGILSTKPEYSFLLPPIPQSILFNYLGQFDETISKSAPFTPAVEEVGYSRHPENQRSVPLELTGLIVHEKLEIRFVYSQALHQEGTIRRLADSFDKHLHHLLAERPTQQSSWTPEDFPLAKLNSEQLIIALAKTNDVEDIYPLSSVQEGILFHTNYQSGTDVYLQQVSGEIQGKLDVEKFKTAWESCINRYPNLRASFVWQDLPRSLQRIHHSVNLPFIYEDWREHSTDEQVKKWSVLLATDRQQGLLTEIAPLMRMTLVRTEAESWLFCWTHHHLLLDGWSLPLVFRDVIAFYQADKSDRDLNLSKPADYRDFIVWLNQKESGTTEAFWRQQLNGLSSATSFGLASRKPNAVAEYQTLQTTLKKEVYTQLKAYAQKNQVTLNTLVQAAWSLLLSKYSGADEVIYGVTVSGRPTELSGFTEMVGLFINTLPLHIKLNSAKPLQDWLIEIRDSLAAINEYSFTPLVDIQAWSQIKRGEPLFESIVVYENYPVSEGLRQHSGELTIHSIESLEKNHYPISLYALPGDDLTLKIAFQPQIGSATERENLLSHLTQILTSIAIEKPQFLGEINLLSKAAVDESNQSIFQRPIGLIHQLFSQQVQKTPEAIAIDPDITYIEIEHQSNQIARTLLQLNVTRETLVAVFLEREASLPIALLGIMKAGAAYLPLDATFPSDTPNGTLGDRISWMLADSGASVIVTQEKIADQLPKTSATMVFLDKLSPQPDTPLPVLSENNHLAYLIYTSGSTGKPKGVQIQHESVVNFLLSFQEKLQLTDGDTLVAVTTVSFDIAGLELFLPLISGARLVIADKETTRDGFKLAQLLQARQATIMQATPTTWRLLLAAGWQPDNGFRILCGGEALPIELAESLLKFQIHLWNVYGPTETTIWSTIKEIKKQEDALSIGKAIANTSIYILDSAGNPVPEGIVGELLIGGIGLARGYRHRPDITAEKFIPNPFAVNPGERLYRTGDLARWLPNGEIEFLGRRDFQVKIRGFRIELGEIETVLESHPVIAQAIVQAIDDTDAGKKLVGYLVIKTEAEKPTIEALQSYLLANLPDYMLPSAWVFLEAMPLTPNNKVDRRSLPSPNQSTFQNEYIAPRNTVEEVLTYIWQEILQVDQVGVMDNFFHLGGHSLRAAQIHARIKKIFLINLELRELFDTVTIAKMAELLLARELQPGRTEKIAKTFLRLKQMTPEEKAKLLQEKQMSRTTICTSELKQKQREET